jgi:hypothetical protein
MALAAQQLGTELGYSASIILDRQGNAVTADFDEIKNFDCSKIQGYVTIFEGELRVRTLGSYELDVRKTRLFGRQKQGSQEDTKSAEVSYPEDDNDCGDRNCGHEHLLGNFHEGKGCYNELRLPGRPAHSSAKTMAGQDLIGDIKSGSKDSKVIDLVISVAQLQVADQNRSAPTDEDFGRVMEASQDRLLKDLVDICFMQRFARYDKAKRDGRDDAASELDSPCLKPPDK